MHSARGSSAWPTWWLLKWLTRWAASLLYLDFSNAFNCLPQDPNRETDEERAGWAESEMEWKVAEWPATVGDNQWYEV